MVTGDFDVIAIGVRIAVHRAFGGAVEKSEQAVVLGVRNRIVFVCMAPGTVQRHAKEYRAEIFRSVKAVFDLELRSDRSAFGRRWIEPDKTSRDFLLECWARE